MNATLVFSNLRPENYFSAEATSAAQLQEAALAMYRESRGNCSESTKMFAKAGCWGKFPGNVEHDIMRSLGLPLEPLPPFYMGMYFGIVAAKFQIVFYYKPELILKINAQGCSLCSSPCAFCCQPHGSSDATAALHHAP